MRRFNGGSVAIYALIDPRDRSVGYVGKTVLPLHVRLSGHISDSRGKYDNKRRRWINELLDAGVVPEIGLIEEVLHDGWDDAERAWILFFRSQGQARANSHAGGQGGGNNRGKPMSPETKAKVSATLKSKPLSPAHAAALAKGREKGWTMTEAQKRKLSDSLHRYYAERKQKETVK